MRDLVFLASAGVRMFIVTTQQLKPKLKLKPGEALTIYVVAPQEGPLETLRRTGVLPSIVVVDEFPAPAS
jgi:hypothetical protein